jgi:hypothetical protein
MNSPKNIEKLIKNAVIHSNPDVNQAVLKELLQQFDNVQEQKPVVTRPKIRRTIMKSPIIKLAAAAVIIVLVLLGLFEFIGTGSTSGVVWAEVVRKVEASRGSASRITTSSPGNPENCTLSRRSPTGYRADMYAGDVLRITQSGSFPADTENWDKGESKGCFVKASR